MKITELESKLKQAYSVYHLNRISLSLIHIYKSRNFNLLQEIAKQLNDYFSITISDDGKGFSKLIKLYHPDHHQSYQNEIEILVNKEDFDGLLNLTHILKLERIEEISLSLNSMDDLDYSEVYQWDFESEGFSIQEEPKKKGPTVEKFSTKKRWVNFYDAVKIRQYGHTDIEFPSYYLEDIDEFELSSSEIDDLEGVQFCLHAKMIDLSENHISDLSPLTGLAYLEELNLSDNQIAYLDDLSHLSSLKRLYISENLITDITPLFVLDHLEFVSLKGNKIPEYQINDLRILDVVVEN